MIGGNTAKLLENVVKSDSKKLSGISRSIFRQPIRVLASFFTAPFLLWKIIQRVENPNRRRIAKIGLVAGIIVAYLAGGFLGTATAALLIATYVGLIAGLAFWLGTAVSVFFTVVFQIFVFNLISFMFLHLSSEDVLEYLHEVSS